MCVSKRVNLVRFCLTIATNSTTKISDMKAKNTRWVLLHYRQYVLLATCTCKTEMFGSVSNSFRVTAKRQIKINIWPWTWRSRTSDIGWSLTVWWRLYVSQFSRFGAIAKREILIVWQWKWMLKTWEDLTAVRRSFSRLSTWRNAHQNDTSRHSRYGVGTIAETAKFIEFDLES